MWLISPGVSSTTDTSLETDIDGTVSTLSDPDALDKLRSEYSQAAEARSVVYLDEPDRNIANDPEKKAYEPSSLANAMFAVDATNGATPEEIQKAKETIAEVIAKSQMALAALPPEASVDQKLRVIHKVVHDLLGWGVESEPNFARGLANRQPDCDIFSLVFHEVGEKVGIPMRLVVATSTGGAGHCFVVTGQGDSFRAVETRANPKEGAQVILRSEHEALAQFERGNNLPPNTTLLYAVDDKFLTAIRLAEANPASPPELRERLGEIDALIAKGNGKTQEEIGRINKPLSEVCHAALASGRLSEQEAALLQTFVDYREKIVTNLEKINKDLLLVMLWRDGKEAFLKRYKEISAEILSRGEAVQSRLDRVKTSSENLNGLLKDNKFPFGASPGIFDKEGQSIDPYGMTFTATNPKKGISVPNVSNVELKRAQDGSSFLLITFRDAPGAPEKYVIFQANGEFQVVQKEGK